MSIKVTVATLIVAVLISGWFFANPTVAKSESEQGVVEIGTVVKKWRQVRTLGKPELMLNYFSDSFIGVGPLGIKQNRTQFVQRLADPKIQVSEFASSKQEVQLHPQMLVITGIYTIKGKIGEREISGQYRYVDVLRKYPTGYKAIACTLTKVAAEPATKPTK